MASILFEINLLDKFSASLRNIKNDAVTKLKEVKNNVDVLPNSINGLNKKLEDLLDKRGKSNSIVEIKKLNGEIKGEFVSNFNQLFCNVNNGMSQLSIGGSQFFEIESKNWVL